MVRINLASPLSRSGLLTLFQHGFDTLEIARRYGLAEHEVYNRLARLTGPTEPRENVSGDFSQPSHGGALAPLSPSMGAVSPSVAGTEKSTDEKQNLDFPRQAGG